MNEHKRVKHRHLPGDLPKRYKIAMREKKVPFLTALGQLIGVKQAAGYRRDLRKKAKTVQRRRDRRAIADGLE